MALYVHARAGAASLTTQLLRARAVAAALPGCSYGVVIGAALAPLVRVLMLVCSPITWPLGAGCCGWSSPALPAFSDAMHLTWHCLARDACMEQSTCLLAAAAANAGKLLDLVLGHEEPVMKRVQLKAMVALHAEHAGAAHRVCVVRWLRTQSLFSLSYSPYLPACPE